MKRHATLPNPQYPGGVLQQLFTPIKEGVTYPTAKDDAQRGIKNEVVDLITLNRRPGQSAAPCRQPPGKGQSGQIS